MNKSESIAELSKAMAKFHQEVDQPMKDKDNPFFKSKYVPLENVVEAINNCAPKHGLAFTQWATNDASGRVGVATLLMHESGEYIEFDPVFMNADKNTAQGAGALISYLKRYSLSAVFGITSDKDDDANEASGNNSHPQQAPSGQQSNGRMATEKQMKLLHFKTGELARAYNTPIEKVKAQLKVTDNMKEVDFKTALKRAQDGIDKAPKDTGIDLPADLEHEDAGDRI